MSRAIADLPACNAKHVFTIPTHLFLFSFSEEIDSATARYYYDKHCAYCIKWWRAGQLLSCPAQMQLLSKLRSSILPGRRSRVQVSAESYSSPRRFLFAFVACLDDAMVVWSWIFDPGDD